MSGIDVKCEVDDWVRIGFGHRKWRIIAKDTEGLCELQELHSSIIVRVHEILLTPVTAVQGEA